MIRPASSLFVPDFSLIRGVYAPHEMLLAPMERLALSAKPGCSFFVNVLVDVPPGVGGTLFSAIHLLYRRARRAAFSFW